MSTGVASQYFEAFAVLAHAEESVVNLLSEVLGCCRWEGFTADAYDDSIEIFGVAPDLVLTESQQRALWFAGFRRCWMHTELTRIDHHEGQKYYWDKSKDVEPSP